MSDELHKFIKMVAAKEGTSMIQASEKIAEELKTNEKKKRKIIDFSI